MKTSIFKSWNLKFQMKPQHSTCTSTSTSIRNKIWIIWYFFFRIWNLNFNLHFQNTSKIHAKAAKNTSVSTTPSPSTSKPLQYTTCEQPKVRYSSFYLTLIPLSSTYQSTAQFDAFLIISHFLLHLPTKSLYSFHSPSIFLYHSNERMSLCFWFVYSFGLFVDFGLIWIEILFENGFRGFVIVEFDGKRELGWRILWC